VLVKRRPNEPALGFLNFKLSALAWEVFSHGSVLCIGLFIATL